MNSEELAKNIRAYRTLRGLTQTEIARRLFVTPQTVSKWEKGGAIPDLTNLCHLAEILSVTPDRLLGAGEMKSAAKQYLGIDGGGTKTDLVLFTENGTVLKRKKVGGSNPNTHGFDTAKDHLLKGIEEISDGVISGVFAGIAGITAGNHLDRMTATLRKCLPGTTVAMGSDIENVIFSVRGVYRCVAMICGTGSAIFAYRDNTLKRFGGHGYLFDGAGSGYDLGRDAITACMEAEDGLRKPSALTDLVEQQLGGKPWARLDQLYAGGKNTIASFAPTVFDAYRAGDPAAEAILRNNFARIARIAKHAQEACGCGDTVICAGGLTSQKEILSRFFAEFGLENLLYPDKPPVYGACARCADLMGISTDPEEFDRNFFRTLPE
ncbi:MAG: XRE family transcriptional regulator [Clostridia bacterium]|nr:XRE family transcriptional regulator [Clostridia bacterium]